ncbi:chemotaxis protein CheC [Pallidibacillus thermolactis]|uniref:chemotaxis protein CheC n=1 Tax=Pallidibacillus thermolactis TaxID=251051 RepID=UPI0021DA0D13|nr:chemotaxis protein CheC [Pallidibacillus thermolactis]MCU9600736.1 chemotaxis protein CheC [Pallidibacillus thermolactis subsp. kokeshiiformis]
MVNKETLNQTALDVLKEVGNIGAGNAATALSKLVKKRLQMKVPSVQIVTFNEMMEMVGGPDESVAAIFLQIEGDLKGNMFFVLPIEQASLFVRQLTGSVKFSFQEPPYSDIALSAFQEMGNIVAGSYLSALSDLLQIQVVPTVPDVGIDMFGAIISYGLLEISKESDYAIVIDTEIIESYSNHQSESPIKGHFFLMPDTDSYRYILTKLGVATK